VQQFVLVQGQRDRIAVTAVNDRGNLAVTTQAAARTFPHVFTDFRVDDRRVRHFSTSLGLSPGIPGLNGRIGQSASPATRRRPEKSSRLL